MYLAGPWERNVYVSSNFKIPFKVKNENYFFFESSVERAICFWCLFKGT